MPNTGRPSTGCALCRSRKVKCDGARPGCGNCSRINKECPGYRSADLSQFHVLTVAPQRQTTTNDEIVERAVCVSLDQLDTTSRRLYQLDVFHFLPKMLGAAGSDSPIYAAMRANATVNMANRMSEDISSLVTVEYSKAIGKVKAALADRELFLKDEVLAAVWLMSKREMFVGLKGSALYAYDTHYSGMLTLLQMRGPRQLETERGRQLFQLFLAPLNWGPLLTRQAPSQQYLELEALMIKTSPYFPDTLLKIHQYYHDVCTSLTRPTRSAEIERLEGDFSRLNASPLVTAKPVSNRPSFIDDQALCLWYFRGWTSFFYWSKLHVARMYLHLSQIQLPASRNIFHQSLRSFLGGFSYALGDIDDYGRSRSEATAATRSGRLKESRGINVLGALHVQAPLRYLTTDPNLYPHESRGVSAALSRLNAEFSLW